MYGLRPAPVAATWDSPAPQPPLPLCDNPRSDKGLISALSPKHGQSVRAGGLQPAASAQPAGDPARPRAPRAAQCDTERSARMGLGVLVVRKKNNQGSERRGSSSCRALPALISTCTAVPARGKFARRQRRRSELRGTGQARRERRERREGTAERAQRTPGQGEPPGARAGGAAPGRGVWAVCTGTHSWAMAPWEMTALSEK